MKIGRNVRPGAFLLAALVVCSLFGAAAHAQGNREENLISARAGGVNFVSGEVSVRRAGESDWRKLSALDDLKGGDSVRTGSDGRAEILLNPGSYFRAGESTEFELENGSLEKLTLRLARGSAVIEAAALDDSELSVVVNTPHARARILRGGVYRFDVTASGATEVAVRKGRAAVGEPDPLVVKGGNVARAPGGRVEVAKAGKKEKDSLDLWSRERGKDLAKMNAKLASRQTNSLLARSTAFERMMSAENPYGFGVWFWNGARGCYTFLPFYAGFASPYGFGYGSWFDAPFGFERPCRLCPTRTRGPLIVNRNTGAPPTVTFDWPATNPGSSGGSAPQTVGAPPASPAPRPVSDGSTDTVRPIRQRTIQPGSRQQ